MNPVRQPDKIRIKTTYNHTIMFWLFKMQTDEMFPV